MTIAAAGTASPLPTPKTVADEHEPSFRNWAIVAALGALKGQPVPKPKSSLLGPMVQISTLRSDTLHPQPELKTMNSLSSSVPAGGPGDIFGAFTWMPSSVGQSV